MFEYGVDDLLACLLWRSIHGALEFDSELFCDMHQFDSADLFQHGHFRCCFVFATSGGYCNFRESSLFFEPDLVSFKLRLIVWRHDVFSALLFAATQRSFQFSTYYSKNQKLV